MRADNVLFTAGSDTGQSVPRSLYNICYVSQCFVVESVDEGTNDQEKLSIPGTFVCHLTKLNDALAAVLR